MLTSAILWGRAPRLLLQAAREKRVELFTSTAVLAELTNILIRRKFAGKIAASGLSVDQLVDGYAQLPTLVRPAALARPAPAADDDVAIGTAIAAKAELLVTGDKLLLTVTDQQGVRLASIAATIAVLESDTASKP